MSFANTCVGLRKVIAFSIEAGLFFKWISTVRVSSVTTGSSAELFSVVGVTEV